MGFTVDEDKMKGVIEMDFQKPQGFPGSIPVKPIPHMEFPRVVYMHPNEPTVEIQHRNSNFEVVGVEVVPTEHLSKTVENEAELKKALAEGWVKHPYIPKPLEDPRAGLYSKKTPQKAS